MICNCTDTLLYVANESKNSRQNNAFGAQNL